MAKKHNNGLDNEAKCNIVFAVKSFVDYAEATNYDVNIGDFKFVERCRRKMQLANKNVYIASSILAGSLVSFVSLFMLYNYLIWPLIALVPTAFIGIMVGFAFQTRMYKENEAKLSKIKKIGFNTFAYDVLRNFGFNKNQIFMLVNEEIKVRHQTNAQEMEINQADLTMPETFDQTQNKLICPEFKEKDPNEEIGIIL